jgi:hypothetical protein
LDGIHHRVYSKEKPDPSVFMNHFNKWQIRIKEVLAALKNKTGKG